LTTGTEPGDVRHLAFETVDDLVGHQFPRESISPRIVSIDPDARM